MDSLKKLFKSKIFLLGLLLRFAVMPFTGHFDIRGINFAVYNLPYKGITNVYEVAAQEPVDYLVNVNFGREYFIYPPLNYFTLGTFMTILKPFYGDEFANWIQGYGNDINRVLTHPHVYKYLFLMKLPYLVFDILLLILLQKFFLTKKDQKLALKYWWLNPIVIFLPYMWGQFDIIPTFFVLWGVYKIIKDKPIYGAFLLGLGASFKNYPLLFLPLVATVSTKSIRQSFKIFITGLLPFIFTTLPYWGHEFFRDTVLFSWQSQKMLDFVWGIGGSEGVYPFMIGYSLIFLYCLYELRGKPHKVHIPIVTSLMWYYATTNFHQQWFMWVLPFIVIYSVQNARFRLIGFWWIIFLFFFRLSVIQANVTTELFVWLSPAFGDLPKTRTMMGMLYDINKLRNIVSSLVMGTSLWVSWYLLKEEKDV